MIAGVLNPWRVVYAFERTLCLALMLRNHDEG